MNKTTIALACCLAACSAPVLAQTVEPAAVVIYGDIDAYLGYIRSSSGNHIIGVNDGSILRSRLGFRGAEDLGSGYQIKYNLEMGFNEDTGTGADTSRLFDRQAWVGINTPAGEFRAGRQNTEIFLIGGAIDYTDRTTFGSIINTFGVPSRYDNDLSYKSSRVSGVQFVAHYALPENGGATRGNPALYQLALDYQAGPYRLGYAGLQAGPNEVTATVHEKVRYHNVYADYKYGNGTVFAAFVRSNNSTSNANGNNATSIVSNVGNPSNFFAGTDLNAGRYYNISQISADYKLSAQLRVGALYGVIHDTTGNNSGARGGNVGGFYDVSKRTILYSFLNYMKNQTNAGFRFGGSGAPSANLAGSDINGRGLTGLQAGIVHKF